MPTQRGHVEEVFLSRELGGLVLRPLEGGRTELGLYNDGGVDMIDPTEMVRRNWFIAMLQHAFVHQLEVSISYPSDTERNVTVVALVTSAPTKPATATAVTKGLVKEIELTPSGGYVEMDGKTTVFGMPTIGGGVFGHHRFVIYETDGTIRTTTEESNERSRVVALLQQALADGLEVSITHTEEPDAVFKKTAAIIRVTLHAKE